MSAVNVSLPMSSKPYLSAQDYRQAPTGVDTQALVKGDSAATDAELLNRIRAASAWADTIMGREIPAIATADTEMRRLPVNSGMSVTVVPRSTPCIQLTAFSYGATPGSLTTMTDFSNVMPDSHYFEVPLSSGFWSSAGPLQFGAPVRAGKFVYCQYSYIGGWGHTTLTGAVSAAGTSITVKDATGILPGQTFLVLDGAQTEQVTVSAAYTSGTTVALAAGVVFPHSSGVTVTALPDDFRTAIILLTSTLIQTRGAVAILAPQLNSLAGKLTQGGSGNTAGQRGNEFVDANVKTATDILQRYRRVPR